jgi:hypothetical protein
LSCVPGRAGTRDSRGQGAGGAPAPQNRRAIACRRKFRISGAVFASGRGHRAARPERPSSPTRGGHDRDERNAWDWRGVRGDHGATIWQHETFNSGLFIAFRLETLPTLSSRWRHTGGSRWPNTYAVRMRLWSWCPTCWYCCGARRNMPGPGGVVWPESFS